MVYAKNKELEKCGHMASVAAAEIISHYGARPLGKLSNLSLDNNFSLVISSQKDEFNCIYVNEINSFSLINLN